jgi:hypothetical protein
MKIGDARIGDLRVLAMMYVYLDSDDGYSFYKTCEVEPVHERWELFEDKADLSPTKCDCCGKRIKYVCVIEHKPTQELAYVGRQCAATISGLKGIGGFKALSKALAHKVLRRKHLVEYLKGHPDMEKTLAWAAEQTFGFVSDVYGKLLKWGNLSPKQAAALKKSYNKQMSPEEKVIKGPAPNGTMEITGKVISTKEEYNHHYNSTTYKMLVELKDGARVFGTIPSKVVDDIKKGVIVKFTANFVLSSSGDISFGFFNRPRKATIL